MKSKAATPLTLTSEFCCSAVQLFKCTGSEKTVLSKKRWSLIVIF